MVNRASHKSMSGDADRNMDGSKGKSVPHIDVFLARIYHCSSQDTRFSKLASFHQVVAGFPGTNAIAGGKTCIDLCYWQAAHSAVGENKPALVRSAVIGSFAALPLCIWPTEQPPRWMGMRLTEWMLLNERQFSSGNCLVIKCLWIGITQSWPFFSPDKSYIKIYSLKNRTRDMEIKNRQWSERGDNEGKKGKGQVREHVYKGPMDKENKGRLNVGEGVWVGQRRTMG